MSETLSDEQLAELSAEGLDSAFATLVLRHRRALVSHCTGLVGQADAEEVVQEALLRAYLALARRESVHHVGPWLRAITHNVALNFLRARAVRPALTDDEQARGPTTGDAFERRERLRAIVHALEELPERQRMALVMRELEGRSYAEIEQRLKTSNGAVRQLLNRARATVRERFDAVAGLVPALRWIVGDGGGAATAARVGALSGGCAVTIKICAATVLPAVLPGAASPNAGTGDRHKTIASHRVEGQTAPAASGREPSSRTLLASRQPLSSAISRQLLTPGAVGAGRSTGAALPAPQTRKDSSASDTATDRGEPIGGVRNGPLPGSASGRPSSTGGGNVLQMGPNVRSGSTSPSASPADATSGEGSPGASSDQSPGSAQANSTRTTAPGNGSGAAGKTGGAGQTGGSPQPGPDNG